jgi:hypothetical protein
MGSGEEKGWRKSPEQTRNADDSTLLGEEAMQQHRASKLAGLVAVLLSAAGTARAGVQGSDAVCWLGTESWQLREKDGDVFLVAGRWDWSRTPPRNRLSRENRYSHDYFLPLALRARENACFAVLTDRAGRAGFVDTYPRNSPNQPHHAGAVLVFDPDGMVLASAQTERICDEMVLAVLDAALLAKQRALPNYTLRTRRPELFGELVRDQVSA